MVRGADDAPPLPPKPITRDEVLPVAARFLAATFRSGGIPDLHVDEAGRQLAVMTAIELVKEVDKQLAAS